MTKANTYTLHVTCDNCDFYGEVTLPKGTAAGHSIECPNCGCKTARKPSKTVQPIYPIYPPLPKPLPPIFPEEDHQRWTNKPEWRYDPNSLPKITCQNSPAPQQVLTSYPDPPVDTYNALDYMSWLIPVIS